MTCVAILGYGAVASIHARRLRRSGAADLVAVFGPREDKARRFADAHGIPNAATTLEQAFAAADAAIICSPSPRHYEQAHAALEAGLRVLVELPPCETLAEAESLRSLGGVACAHTSRYLEPFVRIGAWIREGTLGRIEQIHYLRSIPPRQRSWQDDALLHHAEHPLDLLLHWFGSVRPLGCAALPERRGAQNLAVLAALENGAPVSMAISYTARIPEARLTIAGSSHTVITDGFSYIRSDCADLEWKGNGEETYERAIEEQDGAFLRGSGVQWEETVRVTALVEEFRTL